MNATPKELALLNGYCASALYSARLLGRMLRRTQDLRLRLEMARRANDALRHAQIWADTIRALGERPVAEVPAAQAGYEAHAGRPETLLQALVLCQTFERRLARQLVRHFHRGGTHPIVRATLRRMIEEEADPGWASAWLADATRLGPQAILDVQECYDAADRAITDPFTLPAAEVPAQRQAA